MVHWKLDTGWYVRWRKTLKAHDEPHRTKQGQDVFLLIGSVYLAIGKGYILNGIQLSQVPQQVAMMKERVRQSESCLPLGLSIVGIYGGECEKVHSTHGKNENDSLGKCFQQVMNELGRTCWIRGQSKKNEEGQVEWKDFLNGLGVEKETSVFEWNENDHSRSCEQREGELQRELCCFHLSWFMENNKKNREITWRETNSRKDMVLIVSLTKKIIGLNDVLDEKITLMDAMGRTEDDDKKKIEIGSEENNLWKFMVYQRHESKDTNMSPYMFMEPWKETQEISKTRMDLIGYVPWSLDCCSLKSLIFKEIQKYTWAIDQAMKSNKEWRLFHFKPAVLPHYISVIYPTKNGLVDDEALTSQRKELHEQFGLLDERPYFRSINAKNFSRSKASSKTTSIHLKNIHLRVPRSQVNGKVSLVQGDYEYYHYTQNNVDDKGWGCAYRSLQTICSWFLLQNYTSKPVPSHAEIQQILINLGDKDKLFLNSKQWIGSYEVNLCLDFLYNTPSKIIFVNSGDELPSKARELACHFDTEGTPVMIGGGVLAYTILGVDFNEKTGDVRFLILDPHFTGQDDMKTIIDRGWCGWKSLDLFLKTAYYNMCLPQRPRII